MSDRSKDWHPYLFPHLTDYLTREQRSLISSLPQDTAPTETENIPRRTTYVCCIVPLYSATCPTMCPHHIPLTSILRILRDPPLLSDDFSPPQTSAFRAVVAGRNSTGLLRAVPLRIVEEIYINPQSARTPTSSIIIKPFRTRATACSYPRSSLVFRF